MRKNNPLRNLLNKLMWDPKQEKPLNKSEIIIGDLLEEEKHKNVPGVQVINILARGIEILGGVIIPYHRIITIKKGSGQIYENVQAQKKYSFAT